MTSVTDTDLSTTPNPVTKYGYGSDHSVSRQTGDYTDTYTLDLAGNRLSKVHAANGQTDTTYSFYNGRDELVRQEVDEGSDSTIDSTTEFTYDANGSQTNDGTHKFVYDLQNRLVELTDESNNVIASYGYDDAGNRVSETTSGVTTFYLIDANNSTGYPKPIEEWTSTTGSRANAMLSMTYVMGDRVLAQADGSGTVSYLLTDGHGSTRAMLNNSGVVTATFNYDAYGNALGFDAATAPTVWLFGGDGMYDRTSGLYLHGSGRPSNPSTGTFIISDPPIYGDNTDPITLHKYLYANANPVYMVDPSGRSGLTDVMVTAGIGAILGSMSMIAVNYATGRPQTFSSVAYGALVGGIAGPLAVAFPVLGVGLAGYGIYQGWNLAWQVWTNPRSTRGQLTASLIIFGTSLFGGYAAGQNLAANGWYNPAFTRPPVTAQPGLTPQSPLSEVFQGVPDNAMVHISRAALSDLAEGVKLSVGTQKSYWFRWGDVKHLTPTQYRSIVGPGAQGSMGDANTFVFKLVNGLPEGSFNPGNTAPGTSFQEYETGQIIVPDVGGVVAPNGN